MNEKGPVSSCRTDHPGCLLTSPEPGGKFIRKLLTYCEIDPKTAREMGKAGRQGVGEHYSYRSFRERVRDILRCPERGGRGQFPEAVRPSV